MDKILIRNRSYCSLMISQVCSTLGTWVDLAAVLLIVGFRWQATPMNMGYVIMSFSGAMVLFGIIGGSVASKLPPRLTMVASSIIRAILMLLFPYVTSIWQVCLLIIFKGFFIGVFPHAKDIQMKKIIVTDLIEKGDKFSNRIEEVCKWLGPVGSIGLFVIFGEGVAFEIAAAVYFLACIPLMFVSKGSEPMSQALNEVDAEQSGSGITFVNQSPVLFLGMIAMAAAAMFITVADSQLVILFRALPGTTVANVLACMAASGLGTCLINWCLGKQSFRSPIFWIAGSLLGLGLIVSGVGKMAEELVSYSWLVLFFFIGGVFWQLITIAFQNAIMHKVPKKLLPQVMGYTGVVIVLCYSLGPLAGGVLSTGFGVITAFVICGFILCAAGLALLVMRTSIERKEAVRLELEVKDVISA